MSTLLITILITVVLVLLAVAGLAIGLILTGKPKITRGMCGRPFKKEKDDRCGKDIHCPVCDKPRDKKAEDKE